MRAYLAGPVMLALLLWGEAGVAAGDCGPFIDWQGGPRADGSGGIATATCPSESRPFLRFACEPGTARIAVAMIAPDMMVLEDDLVRPEIPTTRGRFVIRARGVPGGEPGDTAIPFGSSGRNFAGRLAFSIDRATLDAMSGQPLVPFVMPGSILRIFTEDAAQVFEAMLAACPESKPRTNSPRPGSSAAVPVTGGMPR